MKIAFANYIRRLNRKIGPFFAVLFLPVLFFANTAQALIMSPIRAELTGNPGSTVTGTIKAINSDPTSKTFFSNVQTFEATDETGNPTFRVIKSDLATWIKIPDSVTIGPRDSQDVPYTITIPANAEPGGYFAVIFLTLTPPAPAGQSQVTLNTQIGSLVLLRVNGNIQEGADILEFDAVNHNHWYTSLPISFYFRFQNSGQSWVKPLGDMVVQNFFHHITTIFPANPNEGNVLPQSIRRFENNWVGNDGLTAPPAKFWASVQYQWRNFAFGPYTVRLNIAYGGKVLQSATAVTTVWVVPWQLLLVLIALGLIILFLLRFFIKRYNRWVRNTPGSVSERRK